MKLDWELLREQLLALEEDRDFKIAILGTVPSVPTWPEGQSEAEYQKEMAEYQKIRARIFGHLEILLENGYVAGVTISRSSNDFGYGLMHPRLTMAGHQLLDTIRSRPLWEKIKSMAKVKGLDLTLDSIKGLSSLALKSILDS